MKKNAFPMSVYGCIQNVEPNLLLDTVESVSPNSVVCKMQVGAKKSVAYTEDEELPVLALIEVMAQTMSVWNSLNNNRGAKKNRFGILVDISRFVVTRNSHLPKGMPLLITAKLEKEERGYVRFHCEVKDEFENEIIATAKMTGLLPNETQIHDFVKHTELGHL